MKHVGQLRYPWDTWLSKKRIRLKRGRHYQCMTHSMGVQVRNAAIRRGIHVSVFIEEDGLVIERV
jgi:hypothetical protein